MLAIIDGHKHVGVGVSNGVVRHFKIEDVYVTKGPDARICYTAKHTLGAAVYPRGVDLAEEVFTFPCSFCRQPLVISRQSIMKRYVGPAIFGVF